MNWLSDSNSMALSPEAKQWLNTIFKYGLMSLPMSA
jgi:hypothetical protein